MMYQLPQYDEYTLVVVGSNCKLKHDSDLLTRIEDLINWALIKFLDDMSSSAEIFLTDKQFLGDSKPFFVGEELSRLLTQDLGVPAKVVRLEAFNDFSLMKIRVGIAVELEQSFIDNYGVLQQAALVEDFKKYVQA